MDDLLTKKTNTMNVLLGPASERRCTATSRSTGQRCGRAPIVGGYVCNFHGGGLPQVKAKARRRLMALVEPALDALFRALHMGSPCEHCGRSDDMNVVVRAAQLVLDRTGFGAQSKVEVAVSAKTKLTTADDLRRELRELNVVALAALPTTWQEHLTPAEREEFGSLTRRMNELEAAAVRRELGVVEGEVVRAETVDLAEELAQAERELEAAQEQLRAANAALAARS